jgi:hypothetical protein
MMTDDLPKNPSIVPHRIERYAPPMENLLDEWEERIIRFRKESLVTTDKAEESRLRGKADTLTYARAELMNTLEELNEG